jgi:hypothetical protein
MSETCRNFPDFHLVKETKFAGLLYSINGIAAGIGLREDVGTRRSGLQTDRRRNLLFREDAQLPA